MNADRLLTHYERIADMPDAVARLRRFILDLAVCGKLAPQDPNDEPASGLLRRIAAERDRLVQAGHMRRDKSPPPVRKEDALFSLPDGWEWARLGSLIHLVSGQHLQPPEYSDDPRTGLPYITGPSDFGRDGLQITRFALVRKAVAKQDQLLLTVKGSGVGKTTTCNIPEVAISRQLMALTAIAWDRRFLVLVTHRLAETLQGDARSLIPGISRENVEKFVFALPPLAEQHRIVTKVDELMALCDRLEAARTKREAERDRLAAASLARLNTPDPDTFADDARCALDALPAITARPDQIKLFRQTILSLAVRGALVPQDPTDEPVGRVALKIVAKGRGQLREEIEPPFGLPVGWAWRPIQTVADQVTDGEHATPPRISEKQVPLVTAKNVRDGHMDFAQTDWVSFETAEKAWGRCRPAINDILLVCVGATTGRLTVLREAEAKDMVLVRSVALIRPNGAVDPEYLERAIRSPTVQEQIWASVKASAQPCLYINRIQSLIIPLPPLAEQHRIVAKVDELMALCDQLEASLDATATTRRRLLDALLAEALAPAARDLEAAE